jgi:hypothetical protein
MAKANWVRIAESLAQRPHPRLTILCGTILPAEVMPGGGGWMFGTVYLLALTCEEAVLSEHLRACPLWRGCGDAAFIDKQIEFQRWLTDNVTVRPAAGDTRHRERACASNSAARPRLGHVG